MTSKLEVRQLVLGAVKELYEDTNDDKLLEDIKRLEKEVQECIDESEEL